MCERNPPKPSDNVSHPGSFPLTLLNDHHPSYSHSTLFYHGQLFFHSLCWWLCFLFLLQREGGTNRKLTSKSSHHQKFFIPFDLHLWQYAIFVLFVTRDELFGLWAKASPYTRASDPIHLLIQGHCLVILRSLSLLRHHFFLLL